MGTSAQRVKMLLIFFVKLIALVGAVRIFEPDYAAGTYQTILFRQLWNNVDYSKFGRNYTIPNTAQGCAYYCSLEEASAAGVSFGPNEAACISETGQSRCPLYQRVRVFQEAGAQAVWRSSGPENTMSWYNPGPPQDSSSIPLFWPNAWAPDFFSFVPVFETGINVSFHLSFPTQNPIQRDSGLSGRFSWIRFLGLYCGVAVVVLTTFRWTTFFAAQGKVQFDIPTVMLALNAFAGLMIMFNALALNVFNGVSADPFLAGACELFYYWSWSIIATQIMILGFYYGEVARLTSAQSVPGLQIMRIPAMIVILALWVITIVVGSLDATRESLNGGIRDLNVAIFSIAWGLAGFLVIWGTVSLLSQLGSANQNKGGIVRLIVLTGAIVVIFWGCGFTLLVFTNFFNISGVVALDAQGPEYIDVVLLALNIFAPSAIGLIFVYVFRVQIQKEI